MWPWTASACPCDITRTRQALAPSQTPVVAVSSPEDSVCGSLRCSGRGHAGTVPPAGEPRPRLLPVERVSRRLGPTMGRPPRQAGPSSAGTGRPWSPPPSRPLTQQLPGRPAAGADPQPSCARPSGPNRLMMAGNAGVVPINPEEGRCSPWAPPRPLFPAHSAVN